MYVAVEVVEVVVEGLGVVGLGHMDGVVVSVGWFVEAGRLWVHARWGCEQRHSPVSPSGCLGW